MIGGRILKIVVTVAIALFVLASAMMAVFSEQLFELNMRKLNAWVSKGGEPSTIQTDLVAPCTNLVIEQAGWFERIELLTIYRDELDFRIDVCVKVTANRLYKQPEFEKPEITGMICEDKIHITSSSCASVVGAVSDHSRSGFGSEFG